MLHQIELPWEELVDNTEELVQALCSGHYREGHSGQGEGAHKTGGDQQQSKVLKEEAKVYTDAQWKQKIDYKQGHESLHNHLHCGTGHAQAQ